MPPISVTAEDFRDLLPKVALEPGSEMVDRVFEYPGLLPAPYARVEVLNTEGAAELVSRLRNAGRRAELVEAHEPRHGRLFDVHPNLLRLDARGTAIDLGCGAGRDAIWLGSNGWQVTAIDRLDHPGASLQRILAPDAEIEWRTENISQLSPVGPADLVLLHYAWDAQYLKIAAGLVRPGGALSLSAHSPTHHQCFAHPNPSRVFDARQLPPGFEVVFQEEAWTLDRHSVNLLLCRA